MENTHSHMGLPTKMAASLRNRERAPPPFLSYDTRTGHMLSCINPGRLSVQLFGIKT